MRGRGSGWVTAEYAMLPASTGERKERDSKRGRPDGRSIEIQRLIGRSLRAVVDLEALGERAVYVDCDVLQADGGTRCAVDHRRLRRAAARAREAGRGRRARARIRSRGSIAAISVGIVDGTRAARPRLLRGLDRRGRRQRRHDRRRRPRRGAGDRRAHALSRASLDELLASPKPAITELRAVQEQATGGDRAAGRGVDRRRHPQSSTSSRELGRSWPASSSSRFLPRSSCRPRTARPSPRTRSARRAPHGPRPGEPCDRRRLRDQRRCARRASGRPVGAVRRPRCHRRGEPSAADR